MFILCRVATPDATPESRNRHTAAFLPPGVTTVGDTPLLFRSTVSSALSIKMINSIPLYRRIEDLSII